MRKPNEPTHGRLRARRGLILVISATLAIAAPLALAHEGATGVVKQRMEFMKTSATC